MTHLDLQTKDAAAADALSTPQPGSQAVERYACWNEIGVHGDGSCRELQQFVRCRNCPVYSSAAVRLLDRPLPPEYRREWTEHFAQKKAPAAPRGNSAVLFRINAEWLALPTQAFQEIVERRRVHSLPHRQHGFVLGLVNIRGELLICISLGHWLGLENIPPPEALRLTHERLLVADWDGHRYVFPVDELRGIHRFETPEMQEPPATRVKSNLSYLEGVLRWQEKAVGFLDAKLLFSSLNRSLT
jgi:chemotaxis-related protein WspD